MSDPLRTDPSRALVAASEVGRDAKIEQLLLAGLDHYFSAEYDQAINIWTRVLFLDRSHARARAYIERARSALAERQRESEERLYAGLAALGVGGDPRHLATAALAGGLTSDDGLAASGGSISPGSSAARSSSAPVASARRLVPAGPARALWKPGLVLVAGLGLAAAGAYAVAVWGPSDWRAVLTGPVPASPAGQAARVQEPELALPRRGELALARARAQAADGHLHDALSTLDLVKPTDVQKADADRLRGEIQRQLVAIASTPSGVTDRHVP